jgi:GTP pyrophosphokinase
VSSTTSWRSAAQIEVASRPICWAYIFHPINVAKIVAQQIGLDATSICAALLHDVVEDTRFTLEDIERLLGNTVAKIVHGLTKISSLKKDKYAYPPPENFRKM